MEPITSDPASPTAAPDAPKLHRSIVNKAIENYIGAAETFLITVRTDTEINPVMEARGYDTAELDAGAALLQTAADAFGVRLTGLGDKTDKHADLMSAADTARDAYAAFRSIARASFPAQADRVALGLTGNVPQDLQKFITLAHTSYKNAAKAPWSTKMTKRGYDKTTLLDLGAALTALTGTESQSAIAAGDAQEDTTARDLAYHALKDYMKEIMGVARGAFRGNPGALTKLKL